jgi:hypothetical protein
LLAAACADASAKADAYVISWYKKEHKPKPKPEDCDTFAKASASAYSYASGDDDDVYASAKAEAEATTGKKWGHKDCKDKFIVICKAKAKAKAEAKSYSWGKGGGIASEWGAIGAGQEDFGGSLAAHHLMPCKLHVLPVGATAAASTQQQLQHGMCTPNISVWLMPVLALPRFVEAFATLPLVLNMLLPLLFLPLLPAVAEAAAEAYSKGGKWGKAEAEAEAYASSKGGKWGKSEAGEC